MHLVVMIAAFFQQFGLYIMIAAFAAIFGAPMLQRQGKWKAAQWTLFEAMILSGILVFSQLVLGAVLMNMMLLVFGAVCLWPTVSSYRSLKKMGFWHRFRRKVRPSKPSEPKKPMSN